MSAKHTGQITGQITNATLVFKKAQIYVKMYVIIVI